MEESQAVHPIACESCRNKKSKCARELPICSQCTAAGLTCRYPPINKRGIPSGYISFIEQRLFETELVTLELLSSIYTSQIPIASQPLSDESRQILVQFAQKQAKSAKIEEWKALPLNSEEQRHLWWKQRQNLLLSKATPPDMIHASQSSPAQQELWPDESPLSTQYEDMQSSIVAQPASQTGQQHQVSISTWQPTFLTPGTTVTTQVSESNEIEHMESINPSLGSSEYVADMMIDGFDASTTRSTVPDPGPEKGERWRKYF
ncbi:hypothetical protein IQ07DRAFT_2027 [Pyrenochaeta sp. DS3sAY3a]|nr:hypothetical protein IQ07DRAFT_2027 [Pyrenochaeta sp. DS3sAY3a]